LTGSAATRRSSAEKLLLRSSRTQPRDVLPPVAAYHLFAPWYQSYAATKQPYLRRIEHIIIDRLQQAQSRSLLDVGAGDGRRALRIARSANVRRSVLLEPSAGMRAQCREDVEIWPCTVQEIPARAPQFDAITCLWNVLGHLQNGPQRLLALSILRRHLSLGGSIFLDVNHRYNASAYGWCKTFSRILYDFISPSESHGDVIVSWTPAGLAIRTSGHVFTDAEMKQLVLRAGLKVVQRWVVHYESGAQPNLALRGHLLYQLAAA
jgi:SAM-dependent methyltransferase